ncbi:MAG: PIG-L family deacetylase [Verrucomicrobia bacterium]|nr:MAG: PIG-L family deacetylase [Verrucomicrobiota bacterium]
MTNPLRILVFGAHPDDCEFKCAGSAARWSKAGHVVRFVSVTDGRNGHHQIEPDRLVTIRSKEAAAAAGVLGIESEVLPFPDGALEPNLELRREIIRIEREFRPDVIMTHRPNDYHPDHRYTSQVVQDSAYMVTVPHVLPGIPALRRNPAIFYLSDHFQRPYPFTPDAIVPIDDVLDAKIDALACHESQVFEWIPYIKGGNEVPDEATERREWLADWVSGEGRHLVSRFPVTIRTALDMKSGARVEGIEAFEACEYGSLLSPDDFRRLFGHAPLPRQSSV